MEAPLVLLAGFRPSLLQRWSERMRDIWVRMPLFVGARHGLYPQDGVFKVKSAGHLGKWEGT